MPQTMSNNNILSLSFFFFFKFQPKRNIAQNLEVDTRAQTESFGKNPSISGSKNRMSLLAFSC